VGVKVGYRKGRKLRFVECDELECTQGIGCASVCRDLFWGWELECAQKSSE
jgi:hypothetical protein